MSVERRQPARPQRRSCKPPGKSTLVVITFAFLLCGLGGASTTRRARRTASRSLLTPECKQFEPQTCALHHSEGAASVPFCHKGDGVPGKCHFDTRLLSDCPLYAQGTFAQAEAVHPDGCEHPFMQLREPSASSCGHACCTSLLPGSFSRTKRRLRQTLLPFQPDDESCHYLEYSWREAMDCLAGTRVVIAGDSIMRQLFNAGVSLFRGQDTPLDYNRHAHGRYRVCESADSLAFSSFEPARWHVPEQEIGELFGTPASEGGGSCTNGEEIMDLDYLWAPKYTDLTSNLLEFNKRIVSSASSQPGNLAYLVFAGFWEDQQEVSQEFLETLDIIRGNARALIVIGVPRTRLFGWKKDNADVRNNKTRMWVESRTPEKGGNVHFLDFDHLSTAKHAPQAIGFLNWHYQCFLDHGHLQEAKEERGGLQGAWHWPDQPGHIYPSIWTDDAGTCRDEMDATIWQIIFNLLCNLQHSSSSSS